MNNQQCSRDYDSTRGVIYGFAIVFFVTVIMLLVYVLVPIEPRQSSTVADSECDDDSERDDDSECDDENDSDIKGFGEPRWTTNGFKIWGFDPGF